MRHRISYAVACAAAIVAFSAFAEDAYIESDAEGQQSINTGYFANLKTRIEIDFQLTKIPSQGARLFGEDYQSDEPIALYISSNREGVPTIAYTFSDTFDGRDIAVADTVRHTVVFDSPRDTVYYVTEGVTNTLSLSASGKPRTKTANRPLGIFARCNAVAGDSMSFFTPMKLYGFKIYEDDVLLHDYEPVIHRGDAGLYDRVTGEFLQDDQRVSGKVVTTKGDTQQANTRKFGSGGDIRTLTDAEDDGYVILDGVTYPDMQIFNTQAFLTDKTAIEMDYAYVGGVVTGTRAFGVYPKSGAGSVADLRVDSDGDLTFEVGPESYSSVYPFFYMGDRRYRCKLDIPNGKASIASGHTTTWSGSFSARPSQTSNYPIAIGGAMYNAQGNDTGHGKAKLRIYGFKVWEDGQLIRDYVPCVKGTHIGLKDLIGGTFIMPVKVPMTTYGGRILREAGDAYIESDGTNKQYIDTGVTLDATSRVEFDFEAMSTGAAYIFGSCGTLSGYLTMAGLAGGSVEYICKDDEPKRIKFDGTQMYLGARRTMILDARDSRFVVTTCGTTNQSATITDTHTKTMKSTFTLMAARYTGEEVSLFKPMRLYGCRLYKNGEKVRDYVPCVKDGFPGLRDTVTDTFVTNPDMTKKFAFGGEIEMDTPAYVESDGTHILDTGFYPSKNTKVVCDYQLIPGFVEQARVFGAQSGVMCDILYVQGEAKYMGLVYNRYYTEAGATATDFKTIYDVVPSDLWRHQVTLDLHERFYSVDGGTAVALNSVPTEGTDKEASLALFGLKAWGGAIGYPAKARIYSFEIYESGVLKHRYLPYRGADGKVCFKDAKTGQLVNTELRATETSLTIGGCGCGPDGSAFAESPADAKVFIGDTKELSAFAPAALSYQWYCNGEPIAGATGSTCSVPWKKSGTPDAFSVEATFDVCGQEVKKMSSPATVTYMPSGLLMIIR